MVLKTDRQPCGPEDRQPCVTLRQTPLSGNAIGLFMNLMIPGGQLHSLVSVFVCVCVCLCVYMCVCVSDNVCI